MIYRGEAVFEEEGLDGEVEFRHRKMIGKGIDKVIYYVWIQKWTVKKVDRKKTDSLEIWCWRRALLIPWTTRKTNGPKAN